MALSEQHRRVPAELGKALTDLRKKRAELKSITFAPGGGWVILFDKNGFIARNIPGEAHKALSDHAKQGVELKSIAFAPGGGWVVLFDRNGLFARGIPDEAFETLTKHANQGAEIKSISFSPSGGWVVLNNQKAKSDTHPFRGVGHCSDRTCKLDRFRPAWFGRQ